MCLYNPSQCQSYKTCSVQCTTRGQIYYALPNGNQVSGGVDRIETQLIKDREEENQQKKLTEAGSARTEHFNLSRAYVSFQSNVVGVNLRNHLQKHQDALSLSGPGGTCRANSR